MGPTPHNGITMRPLIHTPERFVCSLVSLFLFLAPSLWAKRKDDVVIMRNGDRLTGEVKEIDSGRLVFKAGYMSSSVELDWKEVKSIESQDTFVVTLGDGHRYLGQIKRDAPKANEAEGDFRVIEGHGETVVKPRDVVGVQPMETSFLKQLTGTVDVGLSYFNGNSLTQFTTAARASYQSERNYYSAGVESVFGRQTDADDTTRIDVHGEYRRMFNRNWFGISQIDFLHSSQQQLDLRTTGALGVGRYLIRRNRSTFALAGGAVGAREQYTADPSNPAESAQGPARTNLEGLIAADLTYYKFKTLSAGAQLRVYPGISDPGRVRINTNIALMWEFMRNLTWNFTIYNNFDSRPPTGFPGNDTGVTNAIGWKF